MTEKDRLIFWASGYVLLALSTVLALAVPLGIHQPVWVTLAVVAATALWLVRTRQGMPRWPILHYVVLLALIVALMWTNSWFSISERSASARRSTCSRPAGSRSASAPRPCCRCWCRGPRGRCGPVLASVMLPMIYAGVMIGRQSEKYRRTSEELAEALSENSGLHEQLLVQAREAGVLDERQRMAREIHDTLAQGLAGIGHPAAGGRADRRPGASGQGRPAGPGEPGPGPPVRAGAAAGTVGGQQIGRRGGGTGGELVAGGPRVGDGVDGRAAAAGDTGPGGGAVPGGAEALANVAKHAGASRVGVTLSYLDDQVVLDVRDDGRGFSRGRDGGFGLTVMRQRMDGVGGTLAVESEPGPAPRSRERAGE